MLQPIPQSAFISSKLTTKLAQILKDPLTVCAKCVPPWCSYLLRSCRFLFPFEQRRRFFYAELDPPHTLQFFNKEFEASGERKDSLKVERGDQGEVRLSKLRANKVGVSIDRPVLFWTWKVSHCIDESCTIFPATGIKKCPWILVLLQNQTEKATCLLWMWFVRSSVPLNHCNWLPGLEGVFLHYTFVSVYAWRLDLVVFTCIYNLLVADCQP